MAPLVCTDILSDDFNQIGLNCDAVPIIIDSLESIASAICDMSCAVGHVATTDDCDLLPEDFEDLFPNCDEIPFNAVVLQACACSAGGLKIWVWDGSDWVRIAKEIAIGTGADFDDPNDPQPSELLALFGGHIADEAMVIVRPTAEIYTTQNCGVTWQLLADVPPIGADVENITWNQTYSQPAPDANYFEWFDEILYTNGDSNQLTILDGDLIDLTVVYGYTIVQFADAVDPVDNVNIRFRLSGPFAQFDVDYGNPSATTLTVNTIPVMGIRNGLQYATFNYKIRATQTGNLRLRILSTATGTLPSGEDDWQWYFWVANTSVSVQRVDFA